MFNYQLSQAQVTNQVQQVLGNIRAAMEQAQDLYAWTSQISPSDLEGIGYSAADAQAILDAAADGNSLATLYNGGEFGGSLPYNFSASQRAVLGPQ